MYCVIGKLILSQVCFLFVVVSLYLARVTECWLKYCCLLLLGWEEVRVVIIIV